MASQIVDANPLEAVHGIGELWANRLSEAGIRTEEEFMSLTAHAVHERLAAKGYNRSEKVIKEWQKQLQTAEDRPESNKNAPISQQESDESFAQFLVNFKKAHTQNGPQIKTFVHHMQGGEEGGGKTEEWNGLGDATIYDWMVDQIDSQHLEGMAQSPKQAAPPAPVEAAAANLKKRVLKPLVVTVSQVQIYQPAGTDEPIGHGRSGQLFSGILTRDDPFDLEIELALSRAVGSQQSDDMLHCQMQLYATDRSTGQVILLGEETLSAAFFDKGKSTWRLQQLTLQSGLYRLQSVIKFSSEPEAFGFIEIPLLQVA